jgi:Sec-independent protein translocase protein TatA
MDLWIVLVIILVAVLVWRGPKTLPQLGKAFGRGVREAREEASKAQAEIQARTTADPDDATAADAPTTPADAPPTDITPSPADAPPAQSDVTSSPTNAPPRSDGTPPSAA